MRAILAVDSIIRLTHTYCIYCLCSSPLLNPSQVQLHFTLHDQGREYCKCHIHCVTVKQMGYFHSNFECECFHLMCEKRSKYFLTDDHIVFNLFMRSGNKQINRRMFNLPTINTKLEADRKPEVQRFRNGRFSDFLYKNFRVPCI